MSIFWRRPRPRTACRAPCRRWAALCPSHQRPLPAQGTLWEGRYRAAPIDTEEYFIACCRYIELNPVRARMVDHPRQYRWSSYRAHAEGKDDALADFIRSSSGWGAASRRGNRLIAISSRRSSIRVSWMRSGPRPMAVGPWAASNSAKRSPRPHNAAPLRCRAGRVRQALPMIGR